MTYQQALKELKKARGNAEALAIAEDALAKQIPKYLENKGTLVAVDKEGNETHQLSCPTCHKDYVSPNNIATPFCCWCGQSLVWWEKDNER